MATKETSNIVKRDVLGRVSTPREQREALLDEFERSGLRGAAFARLVGVRYTTFATWVQKRRHARGGYQVPADPASAVLPQPLKTPLRLMEAVLTSAPGPAPAASTTSEPALEVVLPGGVKLLVSHPAQAALAAHLINALHTPC